MDGSMNLEQALEEGLLHANRLLHANWVLPSLFIHTSVCLCALLQAINDTLSTC
jgi:hypothetical protein